MLMRTAVILFATFLINPALGFVTSRIAQAGEATQRTLRRHDVEPERKRIEEA